jgi:hypothetical protein
MGLGGANNLNINLVTSISTDDSGESRGRNIDSREFFANLVALNGGGIGVNTIGRIFLSRATIFAIVFNSADKKKDDVRKFEFTSE